MGDAANSVSPARSLTNSPTNPASSPIHDTVPLVADENPEDGDDLGVEFGAESDTMSLKSSILRYREENGRTYHAYKDGAYALPNDDAEIERLDLQHVAFLLSFDNKLHCAPFEETPQRVLDAGCGTGIWSIEFADEYPEAHVTGVDLSPIQPAFVPPNATFLVDDIGDEWNFTASFDFVFARFMTGSISDWPKFLKQSFDKSNLNSGGIIEIQDIINPAISDDDTFTENCPLKQWSDLIHQGFGAMGAPVDTALHYERQLAEAGFVDIVTIKEKWPTNRWPKDKKYKQIGIWTQENMVSGLPAMSYAVFTRPESEGGLGWSKNEVEVLLAGVRKDMRNTNIHAYWRVHAVYARKP